jgi:hypothetical protein
MRTNWEEITTEILTEHMGALAFIVIEDARAKTRASPTEQPTQFITEFVLRVVQELPESSNRAAIAAQLRYALK